MYKQMGLDIIDIGLTMAPPTNMIHSDFYELYHLHGISDRFKQNIVFLRADVQVPFLHLDVTLLDLCNRL